MAESTLLAQILLLPVAAACMLPFLPGRNASRAFTLAVQLAVLALATMAFAGFDGASTRYALRLPFMPSLGIELHFALDGLNAYLVLLTALLFPVVLACAWDTREGESRRFHVLLLTLEAGLAGTFLAKNLVILFALWEAVLVPMVLLILAFGGPGRRGAALGFFLYTMAGSVPFLGAVILLGAEAARQTGQWSFDLAVLQGLALSEGRQAFVFAALALACAVKSPLVPFHAWLPGAYREASPAGTALMAGLLSKMGAFGFLALAIPLAPAAAHAHAPYLMTLAAIGIVYGAVLALRQSNAKMLVAYASLSHMGYIVVGAFSFQSTGVHGALFQVASHGLSVAGLFLMLGLLEQRYGPAWTQVDALALRAPRFAVVLMLFVLASLALPLTSGFTAEFLVLMGAFARGFAGLAAGEGALALLPAVLAASGVVLGATYMLRFARTHLFDRGSAKAAPAPDLAPRELLALGALLVVVFWIGIAPASWMARAENAVASATGVQR